MREWQEFEGERARRTLPVLELRTRGIIRLIGVIHLPIQCSVHLIIFFEVERSGTKWNEV